MKLKACKIPDAAAESGFRRDGRYRFNCPGCECEHVVNTIEPLKNGAIWKFNGDMNAPTFTPSIHIRTGKYVNPDYKDADGVHSTICHSFVTNGFIHFLNDCTHKLKGQTVPLPEVD